MGDLANMTDFDGRVNGFRLLRWLRSRAEMQLARIGEYVARGDHVRAAQHRGMLAVFLCMADDIERELTPPDYPELADDVIDLDDSALAGGPEAE